MRSISLVLMLSASFMAATPSARAASFAQEAVEFFAERELPSPCQLLSASLVRDGSGQIFVRKDSVVTTVSVGAEARLSFDGQVFTGTSSVTEQGAASILNSETFAIDDHRLVRYRLEGRSSIRTARVVYLEFIAETWDAGSWMKASHLVCGQ
jgi:hypothetical protein